VEFSTITCLTAFCLKVRITILCSRRTCQQILFVFLCPRG